MLPNTGFVGRDSGRWQALPILSAMVALKLWHLLVLMICVLLPTAAAIVWAVRRSRNSR
ncbi:hypothetical protein [Micromonospora sp. DPT]|uniref:hypothetical protein n=1 Tax=Micromonospora sp. DPT TaxID=3142975 RepID=UPI003208E600